MKMPMVLTIAACILAAQPALTQGQEPWNRHQGFYVEGNAGTNLIYLGIISGEWAEAPAATGGFAWHAAGGYAFTEHHAVEAGFMQNYAWYDTETPDNEHTVSTHANVVYGAWRPTLPIGDRLSIFAKLGLMYVWVPGIQADETETEVDEVGMVAPYTGLGLSYAVTPQIDISVQYQGAVYIVAGAGALPVGAAYHF